MRRLLPILLVALLLPAAVARAGTVSLEFDPPDPFSRGGDPATSIPHYDAAPGEDNEVTIAVDGALLTLTDGAGVTAGAGCVRTDPTTAVCTLLAGSTAWEYAQVELGDGPDVMHPSALHPNVAGGPGDDVIDVPDATAIGGPGDDDLTALLVRYDDRREPVDVDLAAGTARLGGETDRLSGVHSVVLSDAADRLRGSDVRDEVYALGGDDVLLGEGGDDSLGGGAGSDRLEGGDGNDLLQAGADEHAPSVLLGGTGDDTISGSSGPDVLDGGPGADHVDGSGGADRLLLRDGAADYVFCGPATRAIADWMDAFQGCRRIDRDAPSVLLLTFAGTQFDPMDGPRGHAFLVCSPDVPTRRCRGAITVFVPSHRSDGEVTPVHGRGYSEPRLILPAAAEAIRRRCGAVSLIYVLRARDTAGRVRAMVRSGVEPGARETPRPGCQTP